MAADEIQLYGSLALFGTLVAIIIYYRYIIYKLEKRNAPARKLIEHEEA